MKLYAQLMMLSVAGRADGLDPGFNQHRPKLNPASANAFSSIADFLPGRVKYVDKERNSKPRSTAFNDLI